MAARWVLLSYRLPGKGSSAPRVATWRALRRLGGAYLADGSYVMPYTEYNALALGQLAHDIRNWGGEANVLYASVADDEAHFQARLREEGPRAGKR